MVERRSKYFVPQGQTKIMNEGWAVLIHEKIMYDLNLPDKYHLAFLKTHNQVVRPIVGRVNPYHLGYTLFKKIEEEYGFEECLLVRETHDDESFIRKYLEPPLRKIKRKLLSLKAARRAQKGTDPGIAHPPRARRS